VGHLQYSPPYNGFTHTVLPLLSRDLLVVSDECVRDNGIDWPKLTWIVDARTEANPVPIATLPLPPADTFTKRGGRFGSHNLYENYPGVAGVDTIVLGTLQWRRAGFDTSIVSAQSRLLRAGRTEDRGRGDPDQRRFRRRPRLVFAVDGLRAAFTFSR
jgi:hypothetical protein